MRFFVFFIVLLSQPAKAQELTLSEADTLPSLIDSLCVDIHPLDGCEQVILLSSQDDEPSADLLILSDRRLQDDPGAPLLILRNAVYNGSMWGMSPSLEEGDVGTVLLSSENTGMGRYPWFQTMRIVWQEDAFRVQSFKHASYDRITTSTYSCSIDYSSREWMTKVFWLDPGSKAEKSSLQSGTVDSPAPLLMDQGDFAELPAPCQTAQALFFESLP